MKALVLDFGGPVLLTPFELLRPAESRLGLPAGVLDWSGPFDPAADPAWRRLQSGEITERTYWIDRAAQFDALTGVGPDLQDLFTVLFDSDPAVMVRPQAAAVLAAAEQAGLATAVLTNDLGRFHPPEWIDRIDFLARVGTIVDGSVTGRLKPDPAAYALVLEALQLPPDQALFVDDQPRNVDGAREVGMPAIWFDVTDPAGSYRQLTERAGLPPR